MKSLSFIAKFSGCTTSGVSITIEPGVFAADFTATGGRLSAVPPADMDRAVTSATRGVQAQDQTVAMTTAVAPMVLDMNSVGPAALHPIVVPRKAALPIGRARTVRHNAPASMISSKTQPMQLQSSHVPRRQRRTPRPPVQKNQCLPKPFRPRNRRAPVEQKKGTGPLF